MIYWSFKNNVYTNDLSLANCVSNYLITGHFGGSVRNPPCRDTSGSHSEHCPFLGHVTCLSQHSCPISGSGQTYFHSHDIFVSSRQHFGKKGAPICFRSTSLISLSTMPPKLKAKNGNAPKSSKKGKAVYKKRQQPPIHLTTVEEMWTTEDEEEPSLKAVMTLLGTMSSRMGDYEKRLLEVMSETTVQAIFTALTAPSTSRALDESTTQGQPPSTPWYSFPDVAVDVRTRVVNHLRAAPALPVHTDENTASEDELEPCIRRKRALKLGKIRTADTLVTKKITWPPEVIYTSQGQPAMYDNIGIALFRQWITHSTGRGK